MRLNNVHIAYTAQATAINISGNRIIADGDARDDLQLFFNKAIAIPGLINSHDHLDFNLLSRLGTQLYNSYTEWGNYIHAHYKPEIDAILAIPLALRAKWGAYKNLLCGVTTVVNHGQSLPPADWPITVIEAIQSIHSVQFEKGWRFRLNNPMQYARPVAIHVGEGTDKAAYKEINQLLKWNLLRRRLIGIHGVAMEPSQAKHFDALVWCPQSNFYLLGKTAAISRLKNNVPVLFGTDSTLTGDWDIWEHIRTAQATQMLSDNELYCTLTTNAAKKFKLNLGSLSPGFDADIVVARNADNNSWINIKPSDILLVVHKGNIRLFDESLYSQLPGHYRIGFSKVVINNKIKFVYGDLPALTAAVKQYDPEAIFPVTCI